MDVPDPHDASGSQLIEASTRRALDGLKRYGAGKLVKRSEALIIKTPPNGPEYLPLLRHILATGTRVVCDTYGVAAHQLRVFVHYQPQFYHLHVHFTRLHNDLGCQVERAHLLRRRAHGVAREQRRACWRKAVPPPPPLGHRSGGSALWGPS